MKIIIPYKQVKNIRNYCSEYISPRRYWLHNNIGGQGWNIYQEYKNKNNNTKIKESYWVLDIDNEYQGLIISLKYS